MKEKVSDQNPNQNQNGRNKEDVVEDNLSAKVSFNINNKNTDVESPFKIRKVQLDFDFQPKDKNSTPSTIKENFKKVPSPNVKQIVTMFEESTKSNSPVSKTTKNATTKLNQPKPQHAKYKANQTAGPATTTPPHRIKKIRSKKLITPAFNYMKISDHFRIKVKAETSTGSPPEEKKMST